MRVMGIKLGVVIVGVGAALLAGIWVASAGGSDNWQRGDLNCSGAVDPGDAIEVLKFNAGLPNDLPIGCPPIGPSSTPSATATLEPTPVPGDLPPPQGTGEIDADGKARVTISNDSRYALTVEFEGPVSRTINMAACATCTDYFFPPIFCPEKGPQEVMDLVPGEYTVTVTTNASEVGAYKGSWPLDGNQGYFSCFIVVKSFGSSTLHAP